MLPINPNPSGRVPSAWRLPGVLAALGLIALYFALQLAAATFISVVIGVREGLTHPGESATIIKAHIDAVMRQPDNTAVLAIIALPLITLITLITARRYWPCMWSLPQPPGFGITRPQPFWLGIAVLVGLIMPLVGAAITGLLAHGHAVTQNVQQLGHDASTALRIPLAAIAAGVAPLVEELLFRGVLLSALMRRLSSGWSVLITAALFALVHLEGLHFQWYALPNLLLLALALGWLRLRSASLWPSVLAHSTYNLFAMVAIFLGTTSPQV